MSCILIYKGEHMTHPEKHILAALSVATTLVVFNIIAVTQGKAEPFYRQLEQFVGHLFS